jgi:hypothetical protein
MWWEWRCPLPSSKIVRLFQFDGSFLRISPLHLGVGARIRSFGCLPPKYI